MTNTGHRDEDHHCGDGHEDVVEIVDEPEMFFVVRWRFARLADRITQGICTCGVIAPVATAVRRSSFVYMGYSSPVMGEA